MTQAELDAIPEIGRFGEEQRIVDGRLIKIPIIEQAFVLSQPFDDPDFPFTVRDAEGDAWMLGYGPDKQLYKRRMYC